MHQSRGICGKFFQYFLRYPSPLGVGRQPGRMHNFAHKMVRSAVNPCSADLGKQFNPPDAGGHPESLARDWFLHPDDSSLAAHPAFFALGEFRGEYQYHFQQAPGLDLGFRVQKDSAHAQVAGVGGRPELPFGPNRDRHPDRKPGLGAPLSFKIGHGRAETITLPAQAFKEARGG
jgi:hypothetical protein